jgi:hypothetical protein
LHLFYHQSSQPEQVADIGKPGVEFEVWEKWKRQWLKLGTLIVSVGGLRWIPHKGKYSRPRSWKAVAEWFK